MSTPSPTVIQSFSLAGKVAVVTGASKGLGLNMARGLAEAGAMIAICARNAEELQQAQQEIIRGLHNARCEFFPADLSQPEQVASLAKAVLEKLGRVDVLVNNAGVAMPNEVLELDQDKWNATLAVNLTAPVLLMREFCPGMKERGWGRVIHISSIAAFGSTEGRHAYSATKSALVGMARTGALELGPFGITVNCIAPGPFETAMTRSNFSPEHREQWARSIPLKRWGNPEKELNGPLLMLASDAGSFVNGATIVVDGGVLARAY
mmetsp:Transcript_39181/g.75103  ORF Transcript_39181/g.75103 Transcript_39181/m.75103 type:complete len:265 (-) Transcript_39181:278-1072(-)|eukprot:CAMPEP_0114248478 /NCGR_PEP_ID=MMETSP0058-20121206/13597_1 /TAXON_ID=36894 /ORGANISM="Pyramimonas parkeae, CCMP726" /LENGTH=264 /DNA_ID=CAMNT_0001361893 /DNA_START=123 /DNA_END=917 /DNA_ORIENTATION=-